MYYYSFECNISKSHEEVINQLFHSLFPCSVNNGNGMHTVYFAINILARSTYENILKKAIINSHSLIKDE